MAAQMSKHHLKKNFFWFQVSDKNDKQFLSSWHEVNKPLVLLFDQVPVVPLLYKVSPGPTSQSLSQLRRLHSVFISGFS